MLLAIISDSLADKYTVHRHVPAGDNMHEFQIAEGTAALYVYIIIADIYSESKPSVLG